MDYLLRTVMIMVFLGSSVAWGGEGWGQETSTRPTLVKAGGSGPSEVNSEKSRFKEDVRAELKQVNALIRKLESKAGMLGEMESKELKETASKLMSKKSAVERELKKAEVLEWSKVRHRVEAALEELEESYYGAQRRLHGTSGAEHYKKALELTEDAVRYGEVGNVPKLVAKAELAKKHARMAQLEGTVSPYLEKAIAKLDEAVSFAKNEKPRTANLVINSAHWYLQEVESRPTVRLRLPASQR